MIHKELFYGCLTAMAVALPLSSCSEEESAVAAPSRDVKLTVTLNRDANDTRSILSEDDDHNLVCNWENDDYILVTDANGNKLGVLGNQSKTGSTTETFSGIITTTLSGDTPLNFLYLGRMSEEELLNTGNPLTIDYSSQDGTIDWISANDFFSKTAEVNISGSVAEIGNLSLERQISFGHFCITLPGEASYSGEDITISGPGIYTQASVNAQGGVTFSNADNSDNGAITITSGSPDFYVTILPKEGVAITPTFSVTIGGKQYAATLDPRTWAPSEFVRGDDGNAMTVKLEAVPEPADDTVGPTFEIDGKKYRLTKGNLYYDTKTKRPFHKF